MSVSVSEKNIQFLAGGGEMGELTRNYDWDQTALGAPDQWPQSLKTTLGIILNSRFPMFLFWGKDLTCFYNDAYRPSLGDNGKHPYALGQPAEKIWPEIWGDIKPLIDQVMAGGPATWSEDQLLPIYRNGQLEDVYWTFSYSPIIGETGKPAGVFVTCTETTQKVLTLEQLRISEQRLSSVVNEAPVPTALYTLQHGELILSMANDVALDLWCKDRSVVGKPLVEAVPEIKDQPFPELIKNVFISGESYTDEEAVIYRVKDGKRVLNYTDLHYKPLKDNDGKVTGVLATAMDVTEKMRNRQKLEEANDQLEFAIDAAELGTFDYDPITKKISANERLKEWFGLPGTTETDLQVAVDMIAEQDRQRVTDAIAAALDYSSGRKFDIVYTIVTPGSEKEVIVHAKGKASFNDKNEAYRFNGTLQDITKDTIARKKIEESERNIRLIIHQAPVSIAIFRGPDYTIETVNEKALELWGRTSEEVMGKPIMDAMPELQRQGIKDLLDDVYTTGKPFSAAELPVSIIRNGAPAKIYVNFTYDPLYDLNGKVDGIFIAGIEVTEQVLSRHKIEESEQQVRLLVESAPLPIAVYTGKELRIELANQAILDIWGKGNNVIGKLYSDILPEPENQKVFDQLNEVYATGNSFHAQNQRFVLGVNGTEKPFYFNYSFTPLFDSFGHVYGIMNTAADVTDLNIAKQKMEEAVEELSKTTQRLQLALEAGNLGSYELHVPTGTVHCTQQCKQNFGRADDSEVTYPELLEMVIPEDREQRQAIMKDALANKKVYDAEYRIKWPDGSIHWIHAAGIPLYDDHDNVINIIGVTSDITKQKLFEEELSRQVQERTKELGYKNIELEKMNDELKSFAYVSSHDLQEPLRKIQTFSDRILEKEHHNLSDTGKDYFSRMQNAAKRMQTLIEDLLAYSRTNSAERIFETTDLNQVVKEVKDDFKDVLQTKHATIKADKLCEANIIPFQFRQLMQNMVSNALKFSSPDRDPVITISAEVATGSALHQPRLSDKKNYCHITIADNGIGFEPEYNERIFEIFQRLHSVSEYQGTGIGLAIVKKIVENHNGLITATSELDKGAVFDIYLPA
ncbi:MAG: hypothetical protein JWQ38_427 [Flavipsychrobacter sp.]|nr:hypothetical protein [Flavipsychrobacter sp.]